MIIQFTIDTKISKAHGELWVKQSETKLHTLHLNSHAQLSTVNLANHRKTFNFVAKFRYFTPFLGKTHFQTKELNDFRDLPIPL